jgi:hypothetical protein
MKIRMIGLDTPETVDPRKPLQCFGLETSAQAKTNLPYGFPSTQHVPLLVVIKTSLTSAGSTVRKLKSFSATLSHLSVEPLPTYASCVKWRGD